ncbi:MAG: ATP synthase F1 subunit epsilon [Erysipelotrichaceae bacterium]|nr:ATP synthase F1 subunit epsilon [Erysipelotrichaceae bacterium]MBQ5805104.1 ATP synthase F1 subunit epsilon [Erysipelotrichaceae bacterium]
MLFKVDLITYKGIYRTIETEKLNVPTSEGRRTILSNHMPIMMPLAMGVIETSKNGKLSHFAVNNGIMYFESNQAAIIADSVLDVDDIDIPRAIADRDRALKGIESARNEVELSRATFKKEVAENFLSAAEKYLK